MTRDPAEFGWHCWSNAAHPPPSSTTYVASYMPSPLLPLPHRGKPRGNSSCQSELRHNHSPLIPIPSTLTCLPYIHPPIIKGSDIMGICDFLSGNPSLFQSPRKFTLHVGEIKQCNMKRSQQINDQMRLGRDQGWLLVFTAACSLTLSLLNYFILLSRFKMEIVETTSWREIDLPDKVSVMSLPNQSLKNVFQELILRVVNCQMMSWLMTSNKTDKKKPGFDWFLVFTSIIWAHNTWMWAVSTVSKHYSF